MSQEKIQNRWRTYAMSAGQGILFGVIFISHFFIFSDSRLDDTYITLRYADNFSEGYFFRYNQMEAPIEGFTSLFNVLLSALFIYFSDSAYLQLKLFGLTFSLIWIGFLATRSISQENKALAMTLTALSTGYSFYATSGMENYLCLPIAAIIIYSAIGSGRQGLWVGSSVFGVMLRPELHAVILFSIIYKIINNFINDRKLKDFSSILAVCAALVAVYVFRIFYFSDFVPNTYTAKYTGGKIFDQIIYGTDYFGGSTTQLPIIAVGALAVLTAIRDKVVLIFASVVFLTYLFFPILLGGDDISAFRFDRLYMPLYGAVVGFIVATDPRFGRLPTYGFCFVFALLSVNPVIGYLREQGFNGPGSILSRSFLQPRVFFEEKPASDLVDYLVEQTPQGEYIAIPWAGYVPYATKLPVIDTLGLNDRQIARSDKSDRGVDAKFDFSYLLSRKPYFYCDNFVLEDFDSLVEISLLRDSQLQELGAIRRGQKDLLRDQVFSESYVIDREASKTFGGTCFRRLF